MDEERELEGKVMVPAGKAGGLIGKGGEVINQLRSSAGCGINIAASQAGEVRKDHEPNDLTLPSNHHH